MKLPQAVRKHDGRLVAYDLQCLTQSIANAARDGGNEEGTQDTWAFASEMARAISEFVVKECSPTPATSDIREMTLKLLRETEHTRTADAYEGHARRSSSLLFNMRLMDGPTSEGVHWDRRRLIESLRASRIARDPAGEVAREVERRLIHFGQEHISAALIHALTALVLSDRGLDARAYASRRVAVSLSDHIPQYNAAAARSCPLPSSGPALHALWLQAIHSQDVVASAKTSALGLEPYPQGPDDTLAIASVQDMADPLRPEDRERLKDWTAGQADVREKHPSVWLLADTSERLEAWPAGLARLTEPPTQSSLPGRSQSDAFIVSFSAGATETSGHVLRAPPITLNVGGVLMREAVRDAERASLRLAQLVGLAAQAHREREEYWGFSATRGRALPILAAGIWNAAAWLCGKPYDQTAPELPLRVSAGTLVAGLNSAIATLRDTTGMNLVFLSNAPRSAADELYERDREHFAKDGLNLQEGGTYKVGLELSVRPGMADLAERVDFLKSVTEYFDEPPPLCLDAPVGREPEPAAWREALNVLAQAGIPQVRLRPGGSRRGMRVIARQLREHLEGYPLFE